VPQCFKSLCKKTTHRKARKPQWEIHPGKIWAPYIGNSPIFYIDSAETPLLIVQGDIDYVSMEQGEEVFIPLYRQAKRARFVRYWGEGHVLESPSQHS